MKHLNGENELKLERESLTVPNFVGVGLGKKSEAGLSRDNFVETMVTVCFLSGAYLVYRAILCFWLPRVKQLISVDPPISICRKGQDFGRYDVLVSSEPLLFCYARLRAR